MYIRNGHWFFLIGRPLKALGNTLENFQNHIYIVIRFSYSLSDRKQNYGKPNVYFRCSVNKHFAGTKPRRRCFVGILPCDIKRKRGCWRVYLFAFCYPSKTFLCFYSSGVSKSTIMSSGDCLRTFIIERLTVAAEEIFRVIQLKFDRCEAELDYQRRLVESVWRPEIKLHRIGM